MRIIGLSFILILAACGAQPPQPPSSQPQSTQRYKSGAGFGYRVEKRPTLPDEAAYAIIGGSILVVGGLLWWALSDDAPPAPPAEPPNRPANAARPTTTWTSTRSSIGSPRGPEAGLYSGAATVDCSVSSAEDRHATASASSN